jgi:hypothetical protein
VARHLGCGGGVIGGGNEAVRHTVVAEPVTRDRSRLRQPKSKTEQNSRYNKKKDEFYSD